MPGRIVIAGSRLILAGMLVLLGLATYALGSPGFARWLIERLESASANALSVQVVSGSLWTGLSVGEIRYQTSSWTLQFTDVQVQPAWGTLLTGQLALGRVSCRELTLHLLPVSGMTDTPSPKALGPIAIPVDLGIDTLEVDRVIVIRGEQPVVIQGLSLGARYRAGEYRVDRARATVFGVDWLARDLTLGDRPPFALSGRVSGLTKAAALADVFGREAIGRDSAESITFESEWSGHLDALRANASLRGWGAVVDLGVRAQLWGPSPKGSVEGKFRELALERVLVDGPTALLEGRFAADFPGRTFSIAVDNQRPGALERRALPVRSLKLSGQLRDTSLLLDQVDLSLPAVVRDPQAVKEGRPELPSPGGRVAGRIEIDRRASVPMPGGQLPRMSGTLSLKDVDPGIVDRRWPGARITGNTSIEGAGIRAAVQISGVTSEPIALDAEARVTSLGYEIARATLSQGDMRLSAQGHLGQGDHPEIALTGHFERIDPMLLAGPGAARPAVPAAILSGAWRVTRFKAAGAPVAFGVELDRGSQFAGSPLSGSGAAQWSPGRVQAVELRLVQGRDRISLRGALGQAGDRLLIDASLADLARFDGQLGGTIAVSGKLSGELNAPDVDLSLRAPRLRVQGGGGSALREVDLRLSLAGQADRHAVRLDLNAPAGQLRLAGEGAWKAALSQWGARFDRLSVEGIIPAKTVAPFELTIGRDGVGLDGMDLALAGGRIVVERVRWSEGILRSSGSLRDLSLGPIADWIDSGGSALKPSDATAREASERLRRMKLQGGWDLSGPVWQQFSGRVDFEIKALEGVAGAFGAEPVFRESLARITLDQGRLDGRASLQVPSLAFARGLTAPDWLVEGALAFEGRIRGSIELPELDGQLTGERLSLVNRSLGWRLRDGRLAARFDGRKLRVDSWRFASGDRGTIELVGEVAPAGSSPDQGARGASALPARAPFDADVSLMLDRFVMPLGPGQRLLLSGQTRLIAKQGGVRWSGAVRADEGLIEFGSAGVPELPADLVIIDPRRPAPSGGRSEGGESAQAVPGKPAWTPIVDTEIAIALGDRLRVQGGGLEARVTGDLVLSGRLPQEPRLNGRVQLRDGTYAAYGRKLELSRGELRFNGEVDNPSLDIVALRKNERVEAGVAVTGPARAPRIRLVSEPDLPDAQKLSWLVLGTGLEDAAAAGQALALREAAMSLLGEDDGGLVGGLAQAFGLDSIGFGRSVSASRDTLERSRLGPPGLPATTSGTSGSSGVRQEVVSVSKRLNSRLTVSYERGLQGLWNLVRLQYEITNRLSLRAQSGSENAVDLLYFWWFD